MKITKIREYFAKTRWTRKLKVLMLVDLGSAIAGIVSIQLNSGRLSQFSFVDGWLVAALSGIAVSLVPSNTKTKPKEGSDNLQSS
jgi:hypothetical protein